MTIIIDLDHTLLNTSLLKVKMFRALQQFGVSQELFDRTYEKTVSRDERQYSYDAAVHGRNIAADLGKPELADPISQQLNRAIESTENLVYEDVFDFLQQARKAGAVIVLLTRGDPKWQQAKIEAAGLRKYVDRVVVAPESKGEVLRSQIRPDAQTFFVTDNAQEIDALEGIKLKVIQLIRPEGKYQQEAQDVPVCRTLNQVWQVIKSGPMGQKNE